MIFRKYFLPVLLLWVPFIAAQTWDIIGPDSTRVTQVRPDPNYPDSIYMITRTYADPGVNLIRTPDAGISWDTLGMYNGVLLHPNTAETLFAALGIGSFSDGIWRSDDYGSSFGSFPPTWIFMAQNAIYDPSDYNCLFAWGAEIQRSLDGGILWSPVYMPHIATPLEGVTVDPTANNRVYAWSCEELLLSTDRGTTWTSLLILPESMSINDVAIAPTDTSIVYMGCWGGILKSTDCCASWDTVPIPPPHITNRIWVSEMTPDQIIAGGAYGLMRSFDGGDTWMLAGDSIPYEVNDFAFGPDGSGGRFWYIATEHMGVWRTPEIPFTEGPFLSHPYPPDSSWVSLESFPVFIKLFDPDGIDISSVAVDIDGIVYTSVDPELTVTDTGIVFEDDFSDGDTVNISITSVDDILGHSSDMLPYDWVFFVDRAPPELLFNYPGPGEVIDSVDIVARFYLEDEGSGIDIGLLSCAFDSIEVDSSSMAFLYDDDTLFIHLPTAGVIANPGDTIQVILTTGDLCTLEEPNDTTYSWFFAIEPTSVSERPVLPENKGIAVSPNPFNVVCRITPPGNYEIYDISGKVIKRIFSNQKEPVIWDGSDESGRSLPSGIYLIKKTSGKLNKAKLILLR
ncbi:hypothetical protein DRQ36_09075 [bacterium]|nr:MAG: hypothetical protein DRQ36_09075 [bacterium]